MYTSLNAERLTGAEAYRQFQVDQQQLKARAGQSTPDRALSMLAASMMATLSPRALLTPPKVLNNIGSSPRMAAPPDSESIIHHDGGTCVEAGSSTKERASAERGVQGTPGASLEQLRSLVGVI